MERCKDFNEALYYLKEGEMLTTRELDQFYLDKGMVERRFHGSHFRLSWEDFKELYQGTVFYVYEDSEELIDPEKDEAYYRYYRK